MRASSPPSTVEQFAFPVGALIAIVLLTLAPDLLSAKAQIVGLGIVVVLFGLPHGALDPWIAEKIGFGRTPGQAITFNLAYLAVAVAVVLVWLWVPTLSLLVFLAISAWHFSGDWEGSLTRPWRLCAGLLLLLMPIGFHTETVASLFSHLSGQSGADLARTLSLPGWFLGSVMLGLIGWAAWLRHWICVLEFALLLALAYLTTPLVYFALYFCLLHSPRHLLGLFRAANTREYPRLMRMMLTYTVATLLLASVLWWLWSAQPLDSLILRLVFIGLAAVTVPHMMLIAAAYFHEAAERNQR
jgi:Brp/Blh family beta-carotene 15,15'-monooxygenase